MIPVINSGEMLWFAWIRYPQAPVHIPFPVREAVLFIFHNSFFGYYFIFEREACCFHEIPATSQRNAC